jgi:integrase
MLAEIRLGADPVAERREQRHAKTVAQLIDTYLAEGPASRPNKRPRSWESDRSNLSRHVRPLLGTRTVQSLTRADIERWQADVAASKTATVEKIGPRAVAHVEGGKGAAARALANFRAMLSWAVEREMIAENPAKGVRPFAGRKCERFLTTEEVAHLGEALVALQAEGELNAYAAAAIRLLVLTGCRKSEILTLQWPFVNFERRCLDLPISKSGAKIVPLAAPALEVLAGLPRHEAKAGHPQWVFPAARGGGCYSLPYKDWQRVAARAGLPGVRMHDLRHSFASVAVSDGASLYVTAKLLGHRQSRTTERYAHLSDSPVRAAAERTAKRLADAMRGDVTGGEVVPLERGKG